MWREQLPPSKKNCSHIRVSYTAKTHGTGIRASQARFHVVTCKNPMFSRLVKRKWMQGVAKSPRFTCRFHISYSFKTLGNVRVKANTMPLILMWFEGFDLSKWVSCWYPNIFIFIHRDGTSVEYVSMCKLNIIFCFFSFPLKAMWKFCVRHKLLGNFNFLSCLQ